MGAAGFVGMSMNSICRPSLLAWLFVCTQWQLRMPVKCWRVALDALQYLDLDSHSPVMASVLGFVVHIEGEPWKYLSGLGMTLPS